LGILSHANTNIGKNVLVVGGSEVAASRAVFALEAQAIVTVISPIHLLSKQIEKRISSNEVRYFDRDFQPSDLNGISMVFVCLNDISLSREIAVHCRNSKIPVNVSSISDLSDFYFLSTFKDEVRTALCQYIPYSIRKSEFFWCVEFANRHFDKRNGATLGQQNQKANRQLNPTPVEPGFEKVGSFTTGASFG
jgi:hypothetical protein